MFLFKFFVSLILAFAMLANAAPFLENDVEVEPFNMTDSGLDAREIARRGYDPSYDWHADHGVVQVWMGKFGVNVGDRTGSALYDTIWKSLDFMCPANSKFNECHGKEDVFHSTCMVGRPPRAQQCHIRIYNIGFHWENDEIRKLLIGAAAGALEAATKDDDYGNLNCHSVTGHGKGCNVGDTIRVNMPDIPNQGGGWEKHNRLTFWMMNTAKTFGNYECCNKIKNIDFKTDGLKNDILNAFPRWTGGWKRESWCIINGWEACPNA